MGTASKVKSTPEEVAAPLDATKLRVQILNSALDFCLSFRDDSSMSGKAQDVLNYADLFAEWIAKPSPTDNVKSMRR